MFRQQKMLITVFYDLVSRCGFVYSIMKLMSELGDNRLISSTYLIYAEMLYNTRVKTKHVTDSYFLIKLVFEFAN